MSVMRQARGQEQEARFAFLDAAGWAGAASRPLAGDASTRAYERLMLEGKSAVLMIAPAGAEAPACTADADEVMRRELGYNAMARLAGPNLNAFVSVSAALRAVGLSAPEVYAADPACGYALLEDLGDDLLARVAGSIPEKPLYSAGVDALAALHLRAPTPPANDAYVMLEYDRLAFEAEAALLMEWYWPLKNNEASSDICTEYIEIWRDILYGLSAPHAFVLRDYHAENLLWLPTRPGIARVGVIDFQDALYGHAAYDLVSLLEDARRDVDPALASLMVEHYAKRMGARFDWDRFERDYAILAAQRNAKILGIFARLAKRDGKPQYLNLLPRVEAHFRNDLARDGLQPLATFCAKHLPMLAP